MAVTTKMKSAWRVKNAKRAWWNNANQPRQPWNLFDTQLGRTAQYSRVCWSSLMPPLKIEGKVKASFTQLVLSTNQTHQEASNAFIIGFNVRPMPQARQQPADENCHLQYLGKDWRNGRCYEGMLILTEEHTGSSYSWTFKVPSGNTVDGGPAGTSWFNRHSDNVIMTVLRFETSKMMSRRRQMVEGDRWRRLQWYRIDDTTKSHHEQLHMTRKRGFLWFLVLNTEERSSMASHSTTE